MFKKSGLVVAVVCLAALPSLAQEKPGTIARLYEARVKDGMEAQYEEGRKRHMDFHKKAGDTWTWSTWQVETGPRVGTYFVASGGHHWKDFDAWDAKMAEPDTADGARNLAPYTAGGGNAFYDFMANVSRPDPSGTISKMSQITIFRVKIGAEQAFINAARKIHEAIGKANWPVHYAWYALMDGGETPEFVLAIPMKGWVSMEEPEPSFPVMLEKAVGRTEAGAIMDSFGQTVRSQSVETWRYRPDLSYAPPAKP